MRNPCSWYTWWVPGHFVLQNNTKKIDEIHSLFIIEKR